MLVEALALGLSVEALDIGVLDGLAWVDEGQMYAAPVRPAIENLSRELRTVVDDNRPRQSSLCRPVQMEGEPTLVV